jgi:O-methyltransferase
MTKSNMDIKTAYLNMLKNDLIGMIRQDKVVYKRARGKAITIFNWLLKRGGYRNELICSAKLVKRSNIKNGKSSAENSLTMIGVERMNNIQKLFEHIVNEDVEGDLVEAGVWKGGATIFMKGLVEVYDQRTRNVWVVDSFEGLPQSTYPQDMEIDWSSFVGLKVSLDEVQDNFRKYGLLDERVKFVKGWFKDTLPSIEIDKIAILRADADMYESTSDILNHLYEKVTKGGYVIIDDYSSVDGCKEAVDEFRVKHRIDSEMVNIDWTGVYWRKE